MNSRSVIAVVAGLLLLIVAGGALWLSNARIMPPVHQTDIAIPDERISH